VDTGLARYLTEDDARQMWLAVQRRPPVA